jgi:hypothetical protein
LSHGDGIAFFISPLHQFMTNGGLFCNNALELSILASIAVCGVIMSGNVTLLCTQRYWLCKSYRKCVLEAGFPEEFSTNYNRYSSSRKCHCVKYSSGHYFNGRKWDPVPLAGKHIKKQF